jgi:ribulose-bisphosphate carboxylase large chain
VSVPPKLTDRIHARYWIETAYPLADAAAMMAGEQSTGTFIRIPGETDELRERYAARVEKITELSVVERPSLPGSGLPKGAPADAKRRTADVELSWPLANMGPSLPNVLAAVAGNLATKGRNSELPVRASCAASTSAPSSAP